MKAEFAGRRAGGGHRRSVDMNQLVEEAKAKRAAAPDDFAFIAGHKTNEDLGEELGEAFVSGVTSGQDVEIERLDRITAEELGGPFVPSTGNREFAGGTDASNIAEATREPFPRTSRVEP